MHAAGCEETAAAPTASARHLPGARRDAAAAGRTPGLRRLASRGIAATRASVRPPPPPLPDATASWCASVRASRGSSDVPTSGSSGGAAASEATRGKHAPSRRSPGRSPCMQRGCDPKPSSQLSVAEASHWLPPNAPCSSTHRCATGERRRPMPGVSPEDSASPGRSSSKLASVSSAATQSRLVSPVGRPVAASAVQPAAAAHSRDKLERAAGRASSIVPSASHVDVGLSFDTI